VNFLSKIHSGFLSPGHYILEKTSWFRENQAMASEQSTPIVRFSGIAEGDGPGRLAVRRRGICGCSFQPGHRQTRYLGNITWWRRVIIYD
jgi:hypothetical protein